MRIISTLFLFLVAFDPQVPFAPNGIGFTFVTTLVLVPFVFLKLSNDVCGKDCFLVKKTVPFIVLFLLAVFFIFFRLIINGGDNIEFVLSWGKAFFVFLSCFFVFLLFYLNRSASIFIIDLFVVYGFNSIINFVVGSYPENFQFLDAFRSKLISDNLGANPYRNSFISGSGYYSIGTAYGLMVLLFSFYIGRSRSKNLIMGFFFALSAISGFVAARTAFFAMGPALFYLFKARFFNFLWLSSLGSVLLFFLIRLPAFQPYINWMLSFFELSGDRSADYLINYMYFWPGDSVALFGLGSVNDGRFTYTDAGYMQDILFGGVFFLLIKMSFVFYFAYSFLSRYPLFVFFVIFSVLAFHFKGLFLYNNAQGMAAFYFICFYLWSLQYGENRKSLI
jgi:hypothetical protein